jgi:hypothetical protein
VPQPARLRVLAGGEAEEALKGALELPHAHPGVGGEAGERRALIASCLDPPGDVPDGSNDRIGRACVWSTAAARAEARVLRGVRGGEEQDL